MNIENYINSGIIEMYVMGALSDQEVLELKQLSTTHPEILNEIERVSTTLEGYAVASKKTPSPSVKPMLMATLDYLQRLENGEAPVVAPLLTKNTKAEDFAKWLERKDMQAPASYEESYAKIISHSPKCSTAIVWLKTGAPKEMHDDQYESFFILEGTCDIVVNNELFPLYPGDQFTVPLHASHYVKVTSAVPCKLILERRAA
ncbi:MAG TPA: cupin domain-containing protein [Bacteroidia bacterium]|jgi:mannose-6-phosphate isomerase-like protein (cupin superfamily)|nr:cupin domain-containing protein [Bacteroidia bacterium]